MAPRTHIQGLDVLRGIAVGLVMLRHAWPETFDGAGIVGVVMFFALSGYLITGVLMRDIESNGRVNYKRFYTNRVLRLVPAMLLVLTVFTVVEMVIGPEGGAGRLFVSVLVGGLYLQDLLPFLSYPGINHLWTLAVEEQFYLVWPALLLLFVRRRWLRVGLLVVIGTAVAICVASVIMASVFFSTQVIYPLPTTWASALILGGAAFVFRERVSTMYQRAPVPLVIGAVVFLAAFSVFPDAKDHAITYVLGGPLVAVSAIILINALSRWVTIPNAAWEPLRALGVISYGAYLWNGPATHWLIDIAHAPAWTTIPATIAAATVGWWMVERPALRLKAKLTARTEKTPAAVEPGASIPQ